MKYVRFVESNRKETMGVLIRSNKKIMCSPKQDSTTCLNEDKYILKEELR